MADTQPVSPLAHGTAVFAGVLMIIGGAFQALEALAVVDSHHEFARRRNVAQRLVLHDLSFQRSNR